MDQIGSVCWFGIGVKSIEGSKSFYTKTFGWTLEPHEEQYYVIMNKGAPIGHMYEREEKGNTVAAPVIYFTVESIDKTLPLVESLGGTVDTPKTAIGEGQGFYAHIVDLDGNIIGIWSRQ